jgi:hypothetical protein
MFKRRIAVSILVISMALTGCKPSKEQPTPTPSDQNRIASVTLITATQKPPTSTPTRTAPVISRCGVGRSDANVRIWVEGQDAQQVCSVVLQTIRQGGGQPIAWNGRILRTLGEYEPICSDALPTFSYEVVDTGGHLYGTWLCSMMVQTYGASDKATEPDLLGIFSAQYTEATRQQAEKAAIQATEQARQRSYEIACEQHHGFVNLYGFCVVEYPGSLVQQVTINDDGTWDEIQAKSNKEECDIDMQSADMDAQAGHPWRRLPKYHADTGVCVRGQP